MSAKPGAVQAVTQGRDLVAELARLTPFQRDRILSGLTLDQRKELNQRWARWAHDGQRSPATEWRVWLIRAGRGFGKTRAGAEWVSAFARANPTARIALVGGTAEDVRRVMIEGEAGLIAVMHDGESVRWGINSGVVRFASGARAFVYSANAPEGLRGPEHHIAWCDELAKWGRGGQAAWDNMLMGLRLDEQPRVLVTTTPRPTRLMRRVMALPGKVETIGRTRDNPHLPASFVEAMMADYAGTRLGRQELDGEMIEEVAGALWSRALIERQRVRTAPALVRVVVGVDPPAGSEGDACGIVAVGLSADGQGYVLEDASAAGLAPEGWARAVAACAARHEADRVIAEKNQVVQW